MARHRRTGNNQPQTDQEAAERERRAWDMRISQGLPARQIAEELNVSQATVHNLLNRVERRLSQTFLVKAESYKQLQTAQLEHLYSETIAAWRRSIEDSVRTSTTTGRVDITRSGDVVHLPDEQTVVREFNKAGDPRFLQVAVQILADIRKIWGLDAAKKVDLTSNHNVVVGYTVTPPRSDSQITDTPQGVLDTPEHMHQHNVLEAELVEA